MGSSKTLLPEEKARLDAILKDLGVDGEEVKVLARSVAELSFEVLSLKLLGADVRVAEQALKAATKNLVAASSVRVAQGVLEFTHETLLVIGKALVHGALAAL